MLLQGGKRNPLRRK